MILTIDSTDPEVIKLQLLDKTKVLSHVFQSHYDLSEKLTLEIGKFLKKNHRSLRSLSKVAVSAGPGGFSRIRTVVAVANSLAFGLNIEVLPVKGVNPLMTWVVLSKVKGVKSAEVYYEKAPNITLSKKPFKNT